MGLQKYLMFTPCDRLFVTLKNLLELNLLSGEKAEPKGRAITQ